MKLQTLLLAVFFSLILSCNEDTNSTECGVENPIEDLDWLAAEIQVMENSGMAQYLYVSQAKYRFMTVFIFGNCCPIVLP